MDRPLTYDNVRMSNSRTETVQEALYPDLDGDRQEESEGASSDEPASSLSFDPQDVDETILANLRGGGGESEGSAGTTSSSAAGVEILPSVSDNMTVDSAEMETTQEPPLCPLTLFSDTYNSSTHRESSQSLDKVHGDHVVAHDSEEFDLHGNSLIDDGEAEDDESPFLIDDVVESLGRQASEETIHLDDNFHAEVRIHATALLRQLEETASAEIHGGNHQEVAPEHGVDGPDQVGLVTGTDGHSPNGNNESHPVRVFPKANVWLTILFSFVVAMPLLWRSLTWTRFQGEEFSGVHVVQLIEETVFGDLNGTAPGDSEGLASVARATLDKSMKANPFSSHETVESLGLDMEKGAEDMGFDWIPFWEMSLDNVAEYVEEVDSILITVNDTADFTVAQDHDLVLHDMPMPGVLPEHQEDLNIDSLHHTESPEPIAHHPLSLAWEVMNIGNMDNTSMVCLGVTMLLAASWLLLGLFRKRTSTSAPFVGMTPEPDSIPSQPPSVGVSPKPDLIPSRPPSVVMSPVISSIDPACRCSATLTVFENLMDFHETFQPSKMGRITDEMRRKCMSPVRHNPNLGYPESYCKLTMQELKDLIVGLDPTIAGPDDLSNASKATRVARVYNSYSKVLASFTRFQLWQLVELKSQQTGIAPKGIGKGATKNDLIAAALKVGF